MDTCCGICNSCDHETNNCTVLEIKCHIYDTFVPSRARMSLPDILDLETMADKTSVVVAKRFIPKGTKFGPFVAKKTLTLNPSILFPIKTFCDGSDDFCEYYLDTTNEYDCNWMMFVTAAENIEEQNLICYQDKSDIYYVSLRDINEGEHLNVWYSSHYSSRMKAQLLKPKKLPNEEEKLLNSLELSKLITKQQNITQRDSWSCKFCGMVETNVINFSSHILKHYELQLKKVCEICRDAFATRKGLKKHIKIVHSSSLENTSDQNCTVNINLNEILKEKKDAEIGGPLLNDMLTDSLDNSNIVLQQTEMSAFDLENQNILIESDNLNVDNILNENVKEIEHFNFEIDKTEEQFVCDICLKVFNKLRLLVQHLKKHTAKYFCSKCSKVFCRNENLKTHICNSSNQFECSICKKPYLQRKYLNRHMETKHSNKLSCNTCEKTFNSNKEKSKHDCGVRTEKQTFSCIICNKIFIQETTLKKHMKSHLSLPVKEHNKEFVCETCGKIFYDKKVLMQHNTAHQERNFECNICGKKFGRREVLNNHKASHSYPQFKCKECGKEFKSKKSLKSHMPLHDRNSVYRCEDCSKIFRSRSNMLKHFKSMHNKSCNICGKIFASPELKLAHCVEHLSSYYSCQFCNISMKFRNSLVRHLKKKHPHDIADIDFNKIKPVTKKNSELKSQIIMNSDERVMDFGDLDKPVTEKKSEPEGSIITNSNKRILNFSDLDERMTNKNSEPDASLIMDSDERVLSFSDLELPTNFDVQPNINEQEACLLSNAASELTLDPDAFMLQSRNSTDSGDLNKVVLYVLDQFPKV